VIIEVILRTMMWRGSSGYIYMRVRWLCLCILRMFRLTVVYEHCGIWAWKWLCIGSVCAYLRLACDDFRAVTHKNEYEFEWGWNESLEFKNMRLWWEISKSSLETVKLRKWHRKGIFWKRCSDSMFSWSKWSSLLNKLCFI